MQASPVCFTAWKLFDLDMPSLRTVGEINLLMSSTNRAASRQLTPRNQHNLFLQMVGTILAYYFVVKQLVAEDAVRCTVKEHLTERNMSIFGERELDTLQTQISLLQKAIQNLTGSV